MLGQFEIDFCCFECSTSGREKVVNEKIKATVEQKSIQQQQQGEGTTLPSVTVSIHPSRPLLRHFSVTDN